MRRPNHAAPKLPKRLLDQIGDGGGQRARGRPAVGRKERRKAERTQKKASRTQPRVNQAPQAWDDEPESDFAGFEDEPSDVDVPPDPLQKRPKSILKKSVSTEVVQPKSSGDNSPPQRRPLSRREKEKLEADDEEIAALEKKLGLKSKKKLPSSFAEDGLDFLLDGLDGGDEDDSGLGKRKRSEDDEWLEKKRRKSQGHGDIDEEEEDFDDDVEDDRHEEDSESMSEGGSWELPDDDAQSDLDKLDDGLDDESDDDHSGHSMDEEEDRNSSDQVQQSRVKENPYVPPVAPGGASTKYVPPAMRAPPASDAESLQRLRRQIQGLLNRLSEANMLSILKEVEHLYQNNARQYVTSTLVDLLLQLVCDRTTLLDTFLILHAGFIAAVYRVVGPDFGAQMVEGIVSRFDQHYTQGTGSKEPSNLVSLISELYNFSVIGSNLMFDYVRLFLGSLSELNTELLLRIIKTSGSQLRQDDPASLKDIVALLHKAVANVGEANLSVRTKFMIETINNLKNNRMKTGVAASALVQEHTTRMKKTLGTLSSRPTKASEPLRVSLDDIRDTEKRGKWWLVGASWRGAPPESRNDDLQTAAESQTQEHYDNDMEEDIIGAGTADLDALAREQRMNTDVRRAIFMAIMSASDFKDAHRRLMKLKLKKSQQFEIPRVLLHCAGAEQVYNPYYTLIARRVCMERKLKKAFEFNLWDLFKRFGERHDEAAVSLDDEDEGGREMGMSKVVNLARTYGTLMAEGVLPMTALKPLNFAYLQPKTKLFAEVLLVTVLLQSRPQDGAEIDGPAIRSLLACVAAVPGLAAGLQYFFRKVISRGGIASTRAERAAVRQGSKAATKELTALMAAAEEE